MYVRIYTFARARTPCTSFCPKGCSPKPPTRNQYNSKFLSPNRKCSPNTPQT